MTLAATSAALLTRLTALVGLAPAESFQKASKASSKPAAIATTWQKPDGAPQLEVRAHRIHNRNAKAAAVYLRKHAILSRGASCDGD